MQYSIIQGGMGVKISDWLLAKLVSQLGGLGTVSCVAAERVMARILQLGDPGGHFRRALEAFPFPEVAEKIIDDYFVEGGISRELKFKPVPIFNLEPRLDLIALTVAASFAFVWLAKEGHQGEISVNYLEKIQIPHLYHLTGAMLAGVDVVTMGAGITLQIPGVLEALAKGEQASYRVFVEGRKAPEILSFDPRKFFGQKLELRCPKFLPVVSTDVLASLMANRLPNGSIQGFAVELDTAGGHNAPPRGKLVLSETGEPVYGPRDKVAFEKLIDLGIPFWIGGSFASPAGLSKAKALGARGVQVGSIFALCEDSGMAPVFRNEIRRLGFRGELMVRTEPRFSPAGFPFKVAQVAGTLSDASLFEGRSRVCDLCALAVPCDLGDGEIRFRCPGEPVIDYVRKGGKAEDTIGVRCLCNGLLAACGLGNPNELPTFTLGDDVSFLRHLMANEDSSYGAREAIAYLLS